MKKTILFFIILTFITWVPSASAQDDTLLQVRDRHVFEVGPEMFFMHYKEPGLMKNEGMMYGGVINYQYRNTVMIGLENRFAGGAVDYESHNTGSSDNNGDFLYEGRLLLGADLKAEKFAVIPFIGFGYRYLYDDSSGSQTTTGAGGYQRESNYFYSPLGMAIEYYLNEEWTLDLKGEYDLFWGGVQRSLLGDALAGHPTVYNDQDFVDGSGFKLSGGVACRIKKIIVKLTAFYHYWRIGDSDTDSVFWNGANRTYIEPRNRSQELGGRLSVLF
ncbi:MAG: hypothetical protein JW938_04580 [Candidatus Omnitrophica bacterium]|nr:hypothetical protein [Candidatus Omnitrophota bacterium]